MDEFLHDSEEVPLSAAGQDRRAEILRLARGAAGARRHRRAARRAAAVALLVLGVFVLIRPHRSISPPLAQRPATPLPATIASPASDPPRPPPQIIVTRIETDPTLLSRWSAGPQKPTWEVLSDDDLLRRLAEAGRPAGLAYVDGHPMLLFREPTRH